MNPLETAHYSERFSPFAYRSDEWKQVYNKRVAVKRVFSRLKTYRKRTASGRGGCRSSLLAMIVAALGVESPSDMRRCV
jgi:hypothetical protein